MPPPLKNPVRLDPEPSAFFEFLTKNAPLKNPVRLDPEPSAFFFFLEFLTKNAFPFSLKARRQASRLPPAAFFREKNISS